MKPLMLQTRPDKQIIVPSVYYPVVALGGIGIVTKIDGRAAVFCEIVNLEKEPDPPVLKRPYNPHELAVLFEKRIMDVEHIAAPTGPLFFDDFLDSARDFGRGPFDRPCAVISESGNYPRGYSEIHTPFLTFNHETGMVVPQDTDLLADDSCNTAFSGMVM